MKCIGLKVCADGLWGMNNFVIHSMGSIYLHGEVEPPLKCDLAI